MRGDTMRDKLSVPQLPLLGGRCKRKKARVGLEPGTIAKANTCSVAGPFVVVGPPDDMSAHRVEIDVASTSQQIGARFNGAAFESTLPGRSRSTFELIEPSCVPAGEALHEQAEIGRIVAWVHDQVHVIRHETVCVDLHTEFLAELAERCQIR